MPSMLPKPAGDRYPTSRYLFFSAFRFLKKVVNAPVYALRLITFPCEPHIDFYGKDNTYVVARLTLSGLKKKIGRCGDTCAEVDDTVKRADTYGCGNGDSCADSR